MTIPEAATLVLQPQCRPVEMFLLDMLNRLIKAPTG